MTFHYLPTSLWKQLSVSFFFLIGTKIITLFKILTTLRELKSDHPPFHPIRPYWPRVTTVHSSVFQPSTFIHTRVNTDITHVHLHTHTHKHTHTCEHREYLPKWDHDKQIILFLLDSKPWLSSSFIRMIHFLLFHNSIM